MHPNLRKWLLRAILATWLVLFVYAVALLLGWTAHTSIPLPVVPQARPQPEVPAKRPLITFIEVTDSCGPHFAGTCVVARSGPGTGFPVVLQLRTGIVLATAGSQVRDGHTWYAIVFDEWVRYPDRMSRHLYVAADFVVPFEDPGAETFSSSTHATTTKRILVDRSSQMLYAYDGDTLFMKSPISTGLDLTPTPRGNFTVYRKTPSRYMQGPLPGISDQYYDLPGVPWNLYFTQQGGAIHGAYWHNNFGQQWSHGCVNLPIDQAHQLYEWADLGTPVTVRD